MRLQWNAATTAAHHMLHLLPSLRHRRLRSRLGRRVSATLSATETGPQPPALESILSHGPMAPSLKRSFTVEPGRAGELPGGRVPKARNRLESTWYINGILP